jgi:Nucleotidyl transferase AbiEii toxin, Type IV TA system
VSNGSIVNRKSSIEMMLAAEFWRTIVSDESGALAKLLGWLEKAQIKFCVIGGQGINAYVEPLVSLDLDLVLASEQIEAAVRKLSGDFKIERFPHIINLSFPGSDLRVQIQTDPRYFDFVARSRPMPVLGIEMPVADIKDLLRAKVWAVTDEGRPSKRQKDLADIGRILEAYPLLRPEVPSDILSRLF